MKDIRALEERAKELTCLYAVDAAIADRKQTPPHVFARVVKEMPAGWQRPESTGACIEYLGRRYASQDFSSEAAALSEPILLWGVEVGRVLVNDSALGEAPEHGTFLEEEVELLRRIAGRLAEYLEWKHSEMLGQQSARTANHWAWRQHFAQKLADRMDPERFGGVRMYIGGSTLRGDAGPASDIDLYVECNGSDEQRRDLTLWLEGWSMCLGEVAHQQTGQPFPDGILGIQWLTGEPGVWQRPELEELTLGDTNGR